MMNCRSLTLDELLQHLAAGWPPGHSDFATEFVERWQKHLRAEGRINQVGENWLQFESDLSGIRLHGIHNVACLALSGQGELIAKAAAEFWQRVDTTDRLVFCLALSDVAIDAARHALPASGCLCLKPAQVRQVLTARAPRTTLVGLIREQYSRRQLVPYNITQPVTHNMFFGRGAELERLRFEPETSFALAGPGRLGKTSLGKQFHHLLTREKDKRSQRKFRVDFYHCSDKSSDGVARHLAINIESSKRSDRTRTEDLYNFLKYQAHKLNGPLELLLDELDEVCYVKAFKVLTMAARNGLCRLVLCGRGHLYRAVADKSSPLSGRVELIRLKPLEEDEARSLILDPLTDLGFELEQPERLFAQVFHWTGRLPHLLQYYGKRLADLAINTGTGIVSLAYIKQIRGEFETAQIFLEQLDSLSEERTRRLALQLIQDGRRHFTVPIVQEIAAHHGLNLDYAQALDACNQLVINNVLAWSEEAFSIANQSLGHYARKMRWDESVANPNHSLVHLLG